MSRTFTIKKAVREQVPILFGIIGPSGSGKTYSALRLATGIQRVMPGRITVIDTEHRRALHYSDEFDFDHLDFGPPFSAFDYMEAIEQAVVAGSRTIIIDSMSHSHEGEGGTLEWHDRIAKEQAARWKCSIEAVQFGAWAEPKAAITKLKQKIIQLGCNVVFCYRAKEKLKPPDRKKGEREMTELGWMPIGDMDLVYEFVANALLEPGSKGVPQWMPGRPGEQRFSKIPKQFEAILNPGGKAPQLSEDLGEAMAQWASGNDAFGSTMMAIRNASTHSALDSCKPMLQKIKADKSVTPAQYQQLIAAAKNRKAALVEPPQTDTGEVAPEDELPPDPEEDGR